MSTKTGLLMVNLGSPDAPTPEAVRKYLFEFLHDKRVITTSRWIWCPFLHGIILRVRPKRSAAAYAKIWGEAGTEAPLIAITRAQVEGVAKRLTEVPVETAMRYGNPSIGSAMDALKAKGCTQIAVLPLYPQYSHTTTASVNDGVENALKLRPDMTVTQSLRDYHDDPRFIKALGESLKAHLATLDWTPDIVLTSYHGLPQSYVDKGDPYQAECIRTTELLREYLELPDDKMEVTFQSRFGPKAWLQPYTDKTLEALAERGVKNIAVVMPGFAADCLETLEEIKIEAREIFLNAGGENFSTVPCLNADETHLDLLAELAGERLLSLGV